jgi:DNA/RNA endonuclease YhcR with UshA esterase domain
MSRLGMINLLNVGLQIINPYHGWHDVAILIMGGLIKVQGARYQVRGNPGIRPKPYKSIRSPKTSGLEVMILGGLIRVH